MIFKNNNYFFSEAQFKYQVEKCEYCEHKNCTEKCPANCSPMDFIKAASVGEPSDIKRSAALIMQMNPFGGVCGMTCPERHCMSGCTKKEWDASIDIPDIQSSIIEQAHKLKVFPGFKKPVLNHKKIAIIGSGPAGLSAAAYLAQKGFSVELFEKEEKAGGYINLIPDFRLPKKVLKRDIHFIRSLGDIRIHFNKRIDDPLLLLEKGFQVVIVSPGLPKPIRLNIKNEKLAITGIDYLKDPKRYNMKNASVAIIGGGAVAADCALTVAKKKAARIEMFALEEIGEMPLTEKERTEIIEQKIAISPRTRVYEILASKSKKVIGLRTIRVVLTGKKFKLANIKDVPRSQITRKDINTVIIAIGTRGDFKKVNHRAVFYAGDLVNGPTTIVEAVASGKNAALQAEAFLFKRERPKIKNNVKSVAVIEGYDHFPVMLQTDFFGRRISTPFLLSAAPPSDGYDQMKKAYEAGWSGGIMKTAFDNVPIHIPSEYMYLFNKKTFANCDNVSGHTLDRVCREVDSLRKEFPDRLTMASTGGSVTGNDESDKKSWQSNTKKLENAGCMGIEYSLSCPQGGEGTEGDIVSQNASLTVKIIDWVLEQSNLEVPKLFKLTASVTAIETIINAIKGILQKYPKHKVGVTLANTFPTLAFRSIKKKSWEDGVVVGMSGEGVLPISFFTLARACPLGIEISGNAGPMDHMSAAHFLALGVRTVQFCTLVMKYGYDVFFDLCSGLSHLMEYRGIKSMKELIGRALPDPITDFMALPSEKKISAVNKELCEHCGNCGRCPYLAISYDKNRIPQTDPEKCIGCSICVQKCFSGALYMRDRTAKEKALLKEK
ncbi:MAG: FAD-dependent oxidoreductase [Spirochaetes bacterium]|nr:FAD-dependent oxidoreductase [Spirochaetota bacterium]